MRAGHDSQLDLFPSPPIVGVEVGQQFAVVEEGDPIQVGGKEIGRRQIPVARIEVTDVDAEFSFCKIMKTNEGVQLAADMKVKELSN